jgi:hypothetical protein
LSGHLKGREYLENLAVVKIKGGGGPTYPSLSSFQAERKMGTYYVNVYSKQTLYYTPSTKLALYR